MAESCKPTLTIVYIISFFYRPLGGVGGLGGLGGLGGERSYAGLDVCVKKLTEMSPSLESSE